MAIGAASAAGMVAWQQNQVIKKLRLANALTRDTAVKPETAGIMSYAEKSTLRTLVNRGKVGETEDQKYFLTGK